MGGGAWKVAYADFVTAMMAFFLLMWILNMSTEDTKEGLAEYFTEGATGVTNISSPVGKKPTSPASHGGKMDTEMLQKQAMMRSYLAILQSIKKELPDTASGTVTSGITTSGEGVSVQLVPDVLFAPGTADLNDKGKQELDKIRDLMKKYDTYLVVRGHADSSEASSNQYGSLWDLSAARANTAVSYLIQQGVNPLRIRSVAYADTQPAVPPTVKNAAELNGRVEFVFHRPEVMSNVENF